MKISTPVKVLLLLLLAVIGWNFWLISARDMYNTATQTDSGPLHNVDFFAYYNAGARFLNGSDPYFWGKDAQDHPIISDFIYPPPTLPVFSLLPHIPYERARLAWLIAYSLAYALILGWMAHAFAPGWRDIFLFFGLAFSLASFPLLSHIEHGQIDIFIICLILACYLAYARKHRLLAAILLAVATMIKVSPGFLMIYFLLFRRDLRFLLMYVASLVVMAAVSLFFVPLGWFVDYVRYVLPEVGKGDSFWLNQSLLKYLSSYPALSRVAGIGGLGLLALVIWFISRRYKADERMPAFPLGTGGIISELVFILNLSGVLIFLGRAWVAAYVWLILPSAWLVIIILSRRIRLAWVLALGAGIGLVLAKVYGFPLLDSLNTWGAFILTACLAVGLLTKKILPPEVRTAEVTP